MVTYTLDSIVKESLLESGESTMAKYSVYYQHAVSTLRELNLDISAVPKFALLTLGPNDAINLPEGYVNYIKIGVIGNDNNFRSMGLNSNLAAPLSFDACGNTQTSASATNNNTGGFIEGWGEGFADNILNGEVVGRMFGIGGGNNIHGYYKIDKRAGVISFSNIHSSQILLEYLADINAVDGNFEVHPFIIQTLKDGIFWRSIQRNLRVGLGDKEMAKDQYQKSHRQSLRRFQSNNLDEWLQGIRVSNQASPKF